jgi:hypothetical protein
MIFPLQQEFAARSRGRAFWHPERLFPPGSPGFFSNQVEWFDKTVAL